MMLEGEVGVGFYLVWEGSLDFVLSVGELLGGVGGLYKGGMYILEIILFLNLRISWLGVSKSEVGRLVKRGLEMMVVWIGMLVEMVVSSSLRWDRLWK